MRIRFRQAAEFGKLRPSFAQDFEVCRFHAVATNSFAVRSTDELVRIAAAGGGLILDAIARPTSDLVRIAAAARHNKARLLIRGMTARTTEDLIRIGAAGEGCVQFEG